MVTLPPSCICEILIQIFSGKFVLGISILFKELLLCETMGTFGTFRYLRYLGHFWTIWAILADIIKSISA